VIAAIALSLRGRTIALFVAIACLPYVLVSNLIVPVGAILAERFLYLPVAGLCLLAATAIHRLGLTARRAAWAVIVILAGLMLARSLDWRSDATIFAATARNNPASPRAPYWLGSLALEAGRPEDAAPYFDASIRNWPAFASPWQETALLAARRGDAATAERNLTEAIRLEPAWASPRLNLALVLHRRGDLDGALKSARKAALLDPEYAKAWAEIGHLQFESGRFSAAADAYRRAVALGRTDLAPRLAEAESK
jgi:tetratricopeptide (TPR) repeat protein